MVEALYDRDKWWSLSKGHVALFIRAAGASGVPGAAGLPLQ